MPRTLDRMRKQNQRRAMWEAPLDPWACPECAGAGVACKWFAEQGGYTVGLHGTCETCGGTGVRPE
jgi:DnaJ-class molecular chaperone